MSSTTGSTASSNHSVQQQPKYPGIRVTCNGNQLVTQWVETRITEGGVFYPITPSTEGGEIYQQSFAQGELNVWGQQKVAVETEGEHAAQGGATALAVTGKRTVNFTSGQGIVYAMEQGFDGVFIAADGEECAYLPDCGERTAKIMTDAQALLVDKGYEPQRVRMAAICSVCAEPFTKYMHEYAASLAGLGPSRKAAA